MPPSPIFYNETQTYLLINGKDKHYLYSSEKTLKSSDTLELLSLYCKNAADYGKIGIGVYAYDKDTGNIRCIAWGETYLDSGKSTTQTILDKSKWKAAEFCFFEKSIEIRIVSWYWDDKKSKWIENDYLIYAHNSQIEYGFKLKVERKCCDILCLSRAKVFKIKVIDKDTNQPIQDATVELCFDCGGTCKSTSPGYESHTTNSNGEVWIEKCAPGVFDPSCITIKASKSGYRSTTSIKNWSDISDCDTYELKLEKPTLINITITVLNSRTKQSVEKAKVELHEGYHPYELIETKHTDTYGKVEFKNLDPQKYYRVYIIKDCYKFFDSGNFLPADKTFEITPYKFCFRVKVIDQSGYALKDAKVELYDNKENFIASDTTNSSGLTDFFLTDKDPIILKVTKPNYTEHKGTIYSSSLSLGDTLSITLYKEGKGDIEVTVIDVAGDPIKGFDAYYKEKTSDAWRHGCSVFDGETNKCTIKDVPYGTYDIKAKNPDYGDATANITHFKPKTTVTITLGAPSRKCSVKFRVYSREGGALVYSLTPLENVSVTLTCEEIGYNKTLKTNSEGEADFGEIDLQNTKRTFHYKVYYNEYWQSYESTRTFKQGYSYDIEIHMERCEELIPGWQRMIMSWLGIQTENITCDEAESLAQQFNTFFLIAIAIFIFLLILSALD